MTPDKTPSEAKLLPCPFCGEAAKHSFNSLYGDMSMASCKSCGATAYAPKWNRRAILAKWGASHGQAPAGAYTDSTPHLKVGDSSFESWYAGYVKEGTKGLKQHCRDAYSAGMGDPLVVAAPTPQADTQPAPVLWLSPEQFANFVDADEAPFGKYIPARKTSAGKFTIPLFAARAPAPAQPVAEPANSASHGQAYPTIDDLCARIKAADDAAAERDYMLDSDDCIKVLRGEWKAPLAMDKPDRAARAPSRQRASDSRRNECSTGY